MKNYKLKNKQGGWIAAAIGGAAVLGGSAISSSGTAKANKQARKLARENRDWQERMSNTAYTRSARDLEDAGLNRILALGGPASTPSGNVAPVENEKAAIGQGVASAAAIAAGIQNTKANTALTKEQTRTLKGPAALGEGIGEILESTKERGLSLYQDYKNKNTSWGPRVKDQLKRPTSAKLSKTIIARQTTGRQAVEKIAKSLGLTPEKTIPLLIKALDSMDIPQGWTDEQKLTWAAKNPEKIKAYLQRQKR